MAVIVAVILSSNYYMPGSMLNVSCILPLIFMLTRVFEKKALCIIIPFFLDEKLRLGVIK